MTDKQAKELVERLKPMQLAGKVFPCPRCGQLRMNAERPVLNALSRYADVYVCNECGTEEALGDMLGQELPLAEWSMARSFRREV